EDLLARVKTCNKLPHILARAEADAAGADDALLLNTRGRLAEATASNLFWLSGRGLITPPIKGGALPGITRDVVIELARKLGLEAEERDVKPSTLHQARGVFLTNSVSGITEAVELDGKRLRRSSVVAKLRSSYMALLKSA